MFSSIYWFAWEENAFHRKKLSSTYLIYGSEMSDLDNEFSKDMTNLDICNTNVINIDENEDEYIDNNNNDADLEVQNNESNEGQKGDDGGE